MVIYIKDNFIKEKDKDMELISLIKFINIKVNGKIIILMEKESFLEIINNFFFKDNFKMDLNMDMVNLNIKMVKCFKENILKIKKEEEEDTFSHKEESYNHNLILYLPKYLR
jgi:hypothetical protein